MDKEIRKIFNFKSEILVNETMSRFGYSPDTLGKSSAKFIMATCRFCGKPHEIRKGFFNKSGSACHKECKLKEQGSFSPMLDKNKREKALLAIQKKYGSIYASQNKEIANKISETKKSKKYQDKNHFSRKHSISNPLWTEEVKEKTKQMLLEKYGCDYFTNSDNIKQQKQREIYNLLKNENQNCLFSDREAISPLELDIYIPDKKFAIEYNGSFWHSEFFLETKDAKLKHIRKTRLCNEKGIRLFHIFEHDWLNRKVQICNFIKTILGLNTKKIMARKCKIGNEPCVDFINDNHIQGYGQGTIKFFNLICENEIVASMTASHHHRQNNENGNIVLNRLCFKDGVSVQGGSSRLFSEFVKWAKSEKYRSIISWSDSRWTLGKVYEILGFTLSKEYDPDYFYWNVRKNCYVSKQSQQKKKNNCPEGMTERDWCQQNGLWRVWDCGKKKWSYEL
jgi:hypothetical protein